MKELLTIIFFTIPYASSSPRLTSTIQSKVQWESYGVWMCFQKESITFQCATYDKTILVPSIRVENNEKILIFDTHVEDGLDCNRTLDLWNNLIKNNSEICVFGAYMPGVSMGVDNKSGKLNSLWYIEKIKTKNGEWTVP